MYTTYSSDNNDDYDDYDGYSWHGSARRSSHSENLTKIKPLVAAIRAHDKALAQLKTQGGDIRILQVITSILKRPLHLDSYYSNEPVTLENPGKINARLREIGAGDYFLDVRLTPYGFPCYYLCRIKTAFWDGYSTIIEDIYMSPDYIIVDPHFIKLMSFGHETFHLRLSRFRPKTKSLFPDETDANEKKKDKYLSKLSKYIFQSAWNESQQLAMLTALHFDLPFFRQAIELIYLILSGELCEIRSNTDDNMKFFFKNIYEQPAILALIDNLNTIEGRALTDLNTLALNSYKQILTEFVSFLKIEVNWGLVRSTHALLNIILANFKRLDYVGSKLSDEPAVRRATKRLEMQSQKLIDGIIQ